MQEVRGNGGAEAVHAPPARPPLHAALPSSSQRRGPPPAQAAAQSIGVGRTGAAFARLEGRPSRAEQTLRDDPDAGEQPEPRAWRGGVAAAARARGAAWQPGPSQGHGHNPGGRMGAHLPPGAWRLNPAFGAEEALGLDQGEEAQGPQARGHCLIPAAADARGSEPALRPAQLPRPQAGAATAGPDSGAMGQHGDGAGGADQLRGAPTRQPPHWLLGAPTRSGAAALDPVGHQQGWDGPAPAPGACGEPRAWAASSRAGPVAAPAARGQVGMPAGAWCTMSPEGLGLAELMGGLERRLAAAEAAAAAAADDAAAAAARAAAADAAAAVARGERAALTARLTVVEGRLRFLEAGDPGGSLAIRAGLGLAAPAGDMPAGPLAVGFPASHAKPGSGAGASAAGRGVPDCDVLSTGWHGKALGGRSGAGEASGPGARMADAQGSHPSGWVSHDSQAAELHVRGTAVPRPPAAGPPPPLLGLRPESPAAPAAVPAAAAGAPVPQPPAATACPEPNLTKAQPASQPASAVIRSADGGDAHGGGNGGGSGGGGRFGSTEALIRALQSRYQEASAFLAQERSARAAA